MHIILSEHQQELLEKFVVQPGMRDKLKKVNLEKAELEDYIEDHGDYMVDITNGKTYLVQYLKALSDLVGKEYAVCAPVRSDGTYGAFYVKPLKTFKKNYNVITNNTNPTPIKKNLYQRMGLNQ